MMKGLLSVSHAALLGALIGATAGVAIALLIGAFVSDHTLWWTPAGVVTGLVGGSVSGLQIGGTLQGGAIDDEATRAGYAAREASANTDRR
jgi:hypothetical protein